MVSFYFFGGAVMKIIEPTAELVTDFNGDDVLKLLETCARVSHKSTSKGNSADFIRKIIKLGHESVLEHFSATFHIICDRAIQNELVRHRHASFTVESTRYVEYDELPAIKPEFNSNAGEIFLVSAMQCAEKYYRDMITYGEKTEIARSILPQCVVSELYMTANLREWRHILKLRTSKAAHPQMKLIAGQILDTFKQKLPAVFEDINHD